LDFFLNDSTDYLDQVKEVFFRLKEAGFFWDTSVDFVSNNTFTTFKVGWSRSNTLLKLDFVNDVAIRFDDIINTDLYYRTDSIRNMLSNKLTAIYRFNPKDVVDIREIALRESINWAQAINDARQKEAGIELIYISDILTGMPQSEFETIAWTRKPSWEEFRSDIDKIIYDMMHG